jgi:hypothetical protein
MKRNTVFPVALLALILIFAGPASWADDDEGEIPFDVANIFFELNDTDGDLGIHALIDGEPLTISWDPVVLSHPDLGCTNEPIDIDRYQLVLEREEPELLKITLDLPPGVTSVDLPEGLVEPGDEIKVEVLVRESSSNQTAIESCFEID